MLKESFFTLVKNFTEDDHLCNRTWEEIEKSYSEKGRHYHTLLHLENLLTRLSQARSLIEDWNTILFSLCFHDVVYHVSHDDNEKRSADWAGKRMASLSVSNFIIEKCKGQIMATKNHELCPDNDTNLFADADLSILGSDPDDYMKYCIQVRKEYSIYPDFIYDQGRKKVLMHYLGMHRIFKTDHFFEKFESLARRNMQEELRSL